jgi:adenosylcobinamide-GDP ribazoletransferase
MRRGIRRVKITIPENLRVPLGDPSTRARALRALRVALQFLTIIPVGSGDDETTEADMAAARYAFPIIGLAIGLVLALISLALSYGRVSGPLSAFLLVLSWTLVSGGLHLDGFADTSDGLFLHGDAERRLRAMRDPHVGSFGILAIVLSLLGKFAALSALSAPPGPGSPRVRALAVLGAVAVGRTLILVEAGLAPYARHEGTGRIVVESTTVVDALWSVVATLTLGALLGTEAGLVAAAAALLVAWGLSHIATQRLGGLTGDILGAVVELGELVYLVILGLFVGR